MLLSQSSTVLISCERAADASCGLVAGASRVADLGLVVYLLLSFDLIFLSCSAQCQLERCFPDLSKLVLQVLLRPQEDRDFGEFMTRSLARMCDDAEVANCFLTLRTPARAHLIPQSYRTCTKHSYLRLK